jgi:CzcA family heavy metal efflux pump
MLLLTAIVRTALRFRGITIALACLFFFYGAHVLNRTQYDIFPEFAPPEVGINTEAPGLAPEQVESLVTQPIEHAVAGTPGIQSLRSQSLQGISAVTVLFDPKTNAYRARQLVSERLAGIASQLPQTAAAPVITPLLSSTGDVQTIGLTSSTRSLRDLRTIADWTVRPHLLGVPGVADVIVYGGEVRQLQVQLEPNRLIRYQLSVADVVAAAQKASGIEGAGFVETPNQQIVLRTDGEFADPAVFARTVIRWRKGEAVTLGDVARVTDAAAPRISTAAVQGRPGVIVKVSLQYGSNTLEVAGRVARAVQDLLPSLQAQAVQVEPGIFRASTFIDTALHNIRTSLLIGAVLVIAVLFLFLFNLRTAAISCTAIPLSLLAAVVVLDKLGFSLNTMTLGGLAIAIGEVVDDAVIDVENILRRLHENRHAAGPAPPFRVVLSASIEVRSAVVYATLAVVLVFLPVMTLSGLAGRIFAPLGAAYVAAILASLLVALTVTPALCFALLKPESIGDREPPAYGFLRGRYERLLHRVERHRGWVVGAVVVLTVAGAVPLYFMSSSFLPTLKEHHFVLHMLMAPGTSLDASLAEGQTITRSLLRLPEVATVGQQMGRAALDEIRGPEASEFDIELKPGADTDAADTHIRKLLTGQPGAAFSLNTFLTERINETLSGYSAPVAVNLYGDDLKLLDLAARHVSTLMGKTRGTGDLQLVSPQGMPELTIRLRPRELLRRGLASVEVLDSIHAAYEGETAGQLHEGSQTYDVSVILNPADRGRLSSIAALPIRTQDGTYVPLGQLADIFEEPGRQVIQHESASRVETITCDVDGRSVGGYEAELGRKVAADHLLPPGVLLQFAGSAQEEARAISDLLVHGALAAVGIVILLLLVLGHRNNMLLVLANLPFALVGGVLFALLFGQGDISLGSLVGFVTVFGITLRNSIMLLSHYEHLVVAESQPWGVAASVRGAGERLVPILMTALVTALGLLPLALGRNAPGREVEGPMALVILGGLATSTLLNLLVLPTLALRWGRFASRSDEEG